MEQILVLEDETKEMKFHFWEIECMLKDPKLQFDRSNIHQSGKYSENLVKFAPKQTVNSIEISLKKQTFQNFVKQKLNKMQKFAKKFFFGHNQGRIVCK